MGITRIRFGTAGRFALRWVFGVLSLWLLLGTFQDGARAQIGSAELPKLPTEEESLGAPSIALRVLPGYGRAPLTVVFIATPVGGRRSGPVIYRWNFGDGQVSAVPRAIQFHTYPKAGTYLAIVTVTTAEGRSATAFRGIVVRPSTVR